MWLSLAVSMSESPLIALTCLSIPGVVKTIELSCKLGQHYRIIGHQYFVRIGIEM